MTPRWVARHLEVAEGIEKVILPGYCAGRPEPGRRSDHEGCPWNQVRKTCATSRGISARQRGEPAGYGAFDIEILAEINHAPRLEHRRAAPAEPTAFRAEGADVIDLGCDPGTTWPRVGDAVKTLRDQGMRVSIDTFDPIEARMAAAAGAELVLSVNASNRAQAVDWGVEVVAIPDEPGSLEGLDATIEYLSRQGVKFRVDPDSRTDRVWLCGFAGPLSRSPPPLSRSSDDHGHGQSHRADRRRFCGGQHDLDRVLPGAFDSKRLDDGGHQLGAVVGDARSTWPAGWCIMP